MAINSLSLYKIGNHYQELLNKLYDHETGEINSLVDEQLSSLTSDIEKKCLSVASFIKTLELDKKELESMKSEINKRESAYDKKIHRMFGYLQDNMERCGIREISSPYFKLKIKENPYSTEILDESLIPDRFIKRRTVTKEEVKPDKIAIKESVLDTGEQIPGANVSRKTKLEILIEDV